MLQDAQEIAAGMQLIICFFLRTFIPRYNTLMSHKSIKSWFNAMDIVITISEITEMSTLFQYK